MTLLLMYSVVVVANVHVRTSVYLALASVGMDYSLLSDLPIPTISIPRELELLLPCVSTGST